MAQIFAYITHKGGVADDSALELVVAAKKIDAGASVNAIVTGSGADLDKVCNDMAATYNEVWKIDNDAMAYPNAEVIRKALVNLLPSDSIVLVPHDTFGMDLSPGLSIKMDSPFVADVTDIEGMDGSTLKLVRQEYAGMVSTHVQCDAAIGAVILSIALEGYIWRPLGVISRIVFGAAGIALLIQLPIVQGAGSIAAAVTWPGSGEPDTSRINMKH